MAGGLLSAGLAALAGYGLRTGGSDMPAGVSRRTATVAPAAVESAAARVHEWHWPTDAQSSYQIEQSIDLKAGDADLVPDACGLTTVVGRLHVCLLEANAHSVTLAMQISDAAVTVTSAGGNDSHRQPVIESLLNATPGLLRLAKDGRLISCDLPAALADEDRIMLQGLFATEFVLGRGSRWEADETTQGLPCRSVYQAETATRFTKSRQAFAAPEGQPSRRIVQSSFTAVPGSFWLETLTGEEKFECLWQNRTVFTASTSIKLARLAEASIPESLLALMVDPAKRAGLVDSASLASSNESRQTAARERQRMARLVEKYGSVPASKMIDDLSEAVAGGPDHAATLPAMHALRDWLLANPARSGEVAEALKNPALADGVTARVAHALELAGRTSMESQAALAAILAAPRDTYPPAVLMQAAVAAGGVGRVQSSDLIQALDAAVAAENPGADYLLNDAALYALGTLARDNSELGQALIKTLAPELALDGKFSPADTATALRTLANARTQDPAIMDQALALAAGHQEPEVRLATIDFFASSGQPEALPAITRALTGDSSDDVRRRAMEVLTSPELVSPESVRPVLELVRSGSKSGPLREFAIASLAPHQDAFPEIRRTFLQLLPRAAGETAELIRQAVSSNR